VRASRSRICGTAFVYRELDFEEAAALVEDAWTYDLSIDFVPSM
jgi:hypothetical protein